MSGLVTRYHTWPTLTTQSVAEHCWGVLRIYMETFGHVQPNVTRYIVYHDAGELRVGDPPFPVKLENRDFSDAHKRVEKLALVEMLGGRGLPDLTVGEATRVKFCDLAEMWEFGLHERLLGNKYAVPIMDDIWSALCDIVPTMSDEDYRNAVGRLDQMEETKAKML